VIWHELEKATKYDLHVWHLWCAKQYGYPS
jgi:hypothetical protein